MGTRERILDAAAEIMRAEGIARATTKEIARQAGFSEAALYKHFSDKAEIFIAVLQERLPALGPVLGRLPSLVGERSVAVNLEDVIGAALAFYDEGFPMTTGIFSERRLLEAHRAAITRLGAGPRHVNHALSAYLRAEQEQGRISAEADPDATAELLLGACLQRAFFRHFYGEPKPAEAEGAASVLVRTVLAGIQA